MSWRAPLAALLAALALPVLADEAEDDPGGTLNPEEMTWGSMLDKANRGETGMVMCASGYMLTKSGDHATARQIFETCAEAGYTGAMTWMSQLDDNGLGAEENPDAAAEWNRRAAEAGDAVGKFNHGIDLLRGRGIAKDPIKGRQMVDAAAAEGVEAARRLQGAGYDLDEVTPDADNWKYAPLF
ncbi:tetratricopeptide repeat protein [Dinoroseobacter sp. S375]|uniref:tetratricopeptide repeat protein n=1 Tax=Dinoroseobacter sp. S375 TaxID=3415136 RepID=UPI003C7A7166